MFKLIDIVFNYSLTHYILGGILMKKKKSIYRESPEARLERVRAEGSKLHTRVVESKKHYNRKKFKKGGINE